MNKHFREKKWQSKDRFKHNSEREDYGIKNRGPKYTKKKSWNLRKEDFLFDEEENSDYS